MYYIIKDRLEGLLELKQNELRDIKNLIDVFQFYSEDSETNKIIAEQIDNRIQAMNSEKYRISFEINKIETLLSNVIDEIDINDLKKLFIEMTTFIEVEIELIKNKLKAIDN